MASGGIRIEGQVTGLPTGGKTLEGIIRLPNAVGTVLDLVLVLGDNFVTIPAGATSVLILPPGGTPLPILVLKGFTTDVGIAINATYPSLLSFDPTQESITINSSLDMTAATQFNFV